MVDPAPHLDLELTQVEVKQDDPAAGFKLERYKYILGQIQFLNDSLHKYLTLFQTLATAILSAGVAVFVGWQKLGVTAEVARLGIRSPSRDSKPRSRNSSASVFTPMPTQTVAGK